MRAQPTSVLAAIRESFRSRRVKDSYAKLEEAIKTKAELVGKAEFCRTMANFYTGRVAVIDPHQQWWDFAEAKEKQYTHQISCVTLEAKIEEATKLIEARTAQFERTVEQHP